MDRPRSVILNGIFTPKQTSALGPGAVVERGGRPRVGGDVRRINLVAVVAPGGVCHREQRDGLSRSGNRPDDCREDEQTLRYGFELDATHTLPFSPTPLRRRYSAQIHRDAKPLARAATKQFGIAERLLMKARFCAKKQLLSC